MKKFYAVRVTEDTHKDIVALAEKEYRSRKVILERAIDLYKQKGGGNAGDSTR